MARAAHDPRLRRLPARAVRGPVPGAGRAGARRAACRSCSRPLPVGLDEQLGPRPRHLVGARATSFPTPTCRSCSSASTRRSRPRSTTSSAGGSRRCATKACCRRQRQPRAQPARLRLGPPRRRAVRLGGALRGAGARAAARRRPRAAVDYEALGRDAHALRAHARSLPAAALRPRRPPPATPSASRSKASTAARSRCWRSASADRPKPAPDIHSRAPEVPMAERDDVVRRDG